MLWSICCLKASGGFFGQIVVVGDVAGLSGGAARLTGGVAGLAGFTGGRSVPVVGVGCSLVLSRLPGWNEG